ncbi:MAG TPA: response regulator [Syntrophales bacterium]
MENALKILLVEDNKTDAVLIQDMIYQADANDSYDVNYELIHKELLRDALKYLAENAVDVILLDLSLPDSKGLDTVKKMGEGEKNAPIIVLTGLDDEDVAIQALQHSVQDYLNKNRTDSNLLHRSIRYSMERFNNIKEKERLIKELKEALDSIKTLSGLLPICAGCKNIRDDDGYWIQVESYLKSHSSLDFTHSICPDCVKKLYPEFSRNKKVDGEKRRHPRRTVSFPALVSGCGSEDKALLQTALVIDISLAGLQILIPSTYEFKKQEDGKASRMTITFALPESQKPLSIECVPQRVFRSDRETKVAASLVDTDVEIYQTLQNYLRSSISA